MKNTKSEAECPTAYHRYSSVDDCIADRPRSLTSERAESFLPSMDICDEWQRKKDAVKLLGGLLGMAGMWKLTWPESKPTEEESRWMISLSEFGSWRWLASIVTHGDDNQITGMHLLAAARTALPKPKYTGQSEG